MLKLTPQLSRPHCLIQVTTNLSKNIYFMPCFTLNQAPSSLSLSTVYCLEGGLLKLEHTSGCSPSFVTLKTSWNIPHHEQIIFQANVYIWQHPDDPCQGLEKTSAGEREEDGEREQKKERIADFKSPKPSLTNFGKILFFEIFFIILYYFFG